MRKSLSLKRLVREATTNFKWVAGIRMHVCVIAQPSRGPVALPVWRPAGNLLQKVILDKTHE